MSARLALCGNVFPADDVDQVLAALRGPVAEWAARVTGGGAAGTPGYGLYLSHGAATALRRDAAQREALSRALDAASVEAWTANAFPLGGFHGTRVKERAFLPDWREPRRAEFTVAVAETLAEIAAPGTRLPVSTCPLGYGPEARDDPATVTQLRRVEEAFEELSARHGVDLVLALEPEPDGALERVEQACAWIAERLPGSARVGVCWDLCHAAVVGEEAAVALAALHDCGVPLGKVQISAALRARGDATAARTRLAAFRDDAYFHQVRGEDGDGAPFAYPDLAPFLDDAPRTWREARVHCHVPVHRDDFGAGLGATAWRAAARAARDAGVRDFELETYTLPVLPEEWLQDAGVVGTMVEETHACRAALALDTGTPGS